MKEQSHKDEMSKALRGDFERLRERGVAATLAPRGDPATEPMLGDAPTAARPEPEPELVAPPDEDVHAPSPGWLGRLLGR